MIKTIEELKHLWLFDKESYRTTEIGTGVQKFVKEVLLCPEIFNFKEGRLSSNLFERNNEFITEAKKKGRRADVVIFVDSDIIIPVEIEKYGSIKSGIKQIFNYQADWQKKYGILTDGNEWWFYNNRFIEKRFSIEQIFNEPKLFLTYWKEYITPEYYYKSFFEKKGQQKLFEDLPPSLDDVREDFFLDITNLIENFENKLNLKGYFTSEINELERKKKAVEITYAYLIQFILYKVLVDNGFVDFEDDWDNRIKSIDKAIKAETYGDVLTKIKGISNKISDKIYKRFNDEQLLINNKLNEILSEPKTEISDVSVWLDIVLFINRYNFSNVQNEIFGYVYENYLKDLYLDEKKGQYFTDPIVADFMLNEIGYTKEKILKRYQKDHDSISIIDPSCGSGTFLYNATYRLVDSFFLGNDKSSKLTEKIVNENIFGFDIAEFPLYLAEMNILMRMLPIIINEKYNNPIEQKIKMFKTRDSVAEFFDTAIKNTLSDINVAQNTNKNQFDLFTSSLNLGYQSFMRDIGDLDNLKKNLELRNEKDRTKFDFVIGNPPYISYNETAKNNILTFELMRSGHIKLNDIYGVNLHSIKNKEKKYRPNPNLYSFFIALGMALLKEDGKLAYIIPQTLLTSGDLDVIRYHLSKFFTINKIILFANKMFVGRGIKQTKPIPTSSLILIVQKSSPKKNHEVEIISYENKDKDVLECITELKIRKNTKIIKIKNEKLLHNAKNWNFIKFSNDLIDFFYDYNVNNDDITCYYDHKLSKQNFNDEFIFDGGYSIDENNRLENPPEDDYYIYPKFNNKSYSKIISTGFWPNNRILDEEYYIGLRQGNQSYKLLDSKFKIVWSYANPSKFYFTDQKIIWARNQFNAIGSNNKNELLYLYSLLNSKLNYKIIYENVKSDNEKDVLFSITSIKTFIKIPKINETNLKVKNSLIEYTNELLKIETAIFSNYIDFSKNHFQKFNSIKVKGNNIEIKYKDNISNCKILSNLELVSKFINNLNDNLKNEENIHDLNDLKYSSLYDVEYQNQIKDFIDDLVFCLYFRIHIDFPILENSLEIKNICKSNKFYNLIKEEL